MKTSGKFLIGIFMVLALLLGTARAARAFAFDDDGLVGPDEVIDDDLLISGGTVTIDGTVNGNVFTSGGLVTVNGTVEGDLMVNGSEVVVNGRVGGSVAFIGQSLTVNGAVDGSVYAIGGSANLGPSAVVGRNVSFFGSGLETQAGSAIGRDVVVNAYQALLAGRVEQDVNAEVMALEIRGDIGGDVTADVGEPAEGSPWAFRWPGGPALIPSGLRVAETARIGGTLTYASPVEQGEAIRSAPGGGVVYRPTEQPAAGAFAAQLANLLLRRVRELVTLLVLGGLVVWRAPALLGQLTERARRRPLPALGWGLLTAIAGYVGAALLAVLILVVGVLFGVVTLGGLAQAVFGVGFSALGLALALFTLLVAYGSKLVVATLVGQLLLRLVAPAAAEKPLWPLVLGVLIYFLLRLVPVLDGLVALVATLIGLGAMALVVRQRRDAEPPASPNRLITGQTGDSVV